MPSDPCLRAITHANVGVQELSVSTWIPSQAITTLSRVASTGVHVEKFIFDPVVFLRTQRTILDQQKRGLMQRLLTWKLRVKTTLK